MNKRILLVCSALAIGAATAAITTTKAVSTKAAASDWSVANGDPSREGATDIEGGVELCGVPCGDTVRNEKVSLNGLTFTMANDYSKGGTEGYCAGLYFSQSAAYAGESQASGPAIYFQHNIGGSGQTRIAITKDAMQLEWTPANFMAYHDEATTAAGFSDATTFVCNALSADEAISVHFEKISFTTWKLTLTEVSESFFWASNNYNLATNEAGRTVGTYYLKDSDMGLDDDGKAFMHSNFVSGTGTTYGLKVTNLVDGSKWEAPKTDVTGVTLNKSETTLDVGDAETLVATVAPADASIPTVNWSTSDASVATVSNGVVRGVAAGTATITATTEDGGYTATCAVTVSAPTVSTDWSVANGDPAREIAYTKSNGYNVQVGGPHADVVKNEKITLDGFEMDFGSSYVAGQTDAAFYFSSTTNMDYGNQIVFTQEHSYRNAPGRQTRFSANVGGYSDAGSAGYSSPDLSAGKGLSGAVTMVFNCLTSDEDFHIKFARESYSWWKVTVTAPSTYLWSSVNYNVVDNGDGTVSSSFYLYNEDLPLDAEGKAYLHVTNEIATTVTAKVRNIQDGTYHEFEEPAATAEQVATYVDKLHAIDLSSYDPSLIQSMEAVRTAAEAIMTAEGAKFSQIVKAYDDACADIRTLNDAFDFPEALTTFGEEADATANWVDEYGQGVKGNRVNDHGGVMASIPNQYGYRGRFAAQYDLTNFSIRFDASRLPSGSVLGLAVSDTNAEPYVSADSGKLFSMDFYKWGKGQMMSTLSGATQDHNYSVEGYEIAGETYHGAYHGQKNDCFSEIYEMSFATDYETGKTVVTINGKQTTLDSAVLYGKAPTEPLMGNIALGVFNGDGSAALVRVDYVKDATHGNDEIVDAKAAIDAAKAEVLSKLPASGELTDATYADYKAAETAAEATIKAAIVTNPENEVTYLTAYAKAAIDEIKAPLAAYEARVASTKTAAIEDLNNYVNLDNYYDEQADLVNAAIRSGVSAINAATTLDGVSSALASAKAAIDAIPNKAAVDLANKKTSAKDEISAYVNQLDSSKYSEENQKKIIAIADKAKTDIDAATSIADIEAIVTKAKADIDAIEQIKKGCGGSVVAASAIVASLALAGAVVLTKKKHD